MFCARLFICALWSPAGKGLTSWLSFVVSSVSLSLSHWYPGSGVVLDCIDSWSLHHYLLLIKMYEWHGTIYKHFSKMMLFISPNHRNQLLSMSRWSTFKQSLVLNCVVPGYDHSSDIPIIVRIVSCCVCWAHRGLTGDFFWSGTQLYILLSPYVCFISFLYFNLYIDKLGIFQANYTSRCLHPHQN